METQKPTENQEEKIDGVNKVPFGPKEMEVTMSGPAVLSNRFFITITPCDPRITFTEQSSPDASPVFRTAVVLPFQDAITLYKLLQDLLKEPEAVLKKAMEGMQEGQENG